MRDFMVVLLFELKNRLKQKATIISTVIILTIVLVVTFIPRYLDLNPTSSEATEMVDTTQPSEEDVYQIPSFGVLTVNQTDLSSLSQHPYFSDVTKYETVEALNEAVETEQVDYGLIFTSFNEVKLVANDIGMFDMTPSTISDFLSTVARNEYLSEHGIDPLIVDEATYNSLVSVEIETLGKSQGNSFWFVYVGVFIIYFLIILYGQSVSTAVALEKNDRTMELLITNTSSTNLIWGKVVASTIVSGTQMILTILAAVIGYMLNQSFYPEPLVMMISEGIGLDLLVIFVVFAILGMLLYYFLYAAVGALVSKVEEVNSAMAPIQILFVAGYMIVMFGLYIPDSLLMRVASIVPFTSSITMFARYALVTVPIWEIGLSLGLLGFTTWLMSYISIRIYRMGTLNYGNRIGFMKALRMVFTKEGQV